MAGGKVFFDQVNAGGVNYPPNALLFTGGSTQLTVADTMITVNAASGGTITLPELADIQVGHTITIVRLDTGSDVTVLVGAVGDFIQGPIVGFPIPGVLYWRTILQVHNDGVNPIWIVFDVG